jgi:N-acetyl-alpha-D-glucosaminyl L-malate synthase BshA
MKIGITCYPTYGGSGVIATELGKALALRGHEVHFISYALPFRLHNFVENVVFHEVEMSSYPLFEFPLYSLALASKMVEVAEYEKLDVFHVHYAIPHASSAYLAKEMLKEKIDIKIITTLHGTDITLVGLEPSFLPLVKFSIENSDGVTAVSRFLKEKTLTNYDIDKDIQVIPNFIDTKLFKPDSDCSFRKKISAKGEKILVHTSNFRQVKRVTDAIKIFDIVQKEIPSKLILVGDGPDRSECERLVRQLNLGDKVKTD